MTVTRFAIAVCLALTACKTPRDATRTELLWPDGAPRARGKLKGDKPALFYFLPAPQQRNGLLAVIASGGSYGHHGGLPHEGFNTARWLVERGITAVVVRYRVGGSGRYNHVDFIADGKRAVRTVRSQAEELGIDPDRIGMMGFSAGGHLASSLANQCPNDTGDPGADDPVERASCRIAWAVAVYPVISQDDRYAHRRSRRNLLRRIKNPPPELLVELSTNTQVNTNTSPIFIVTTKRDSKVDWRNSQLLYDALLNNGIETHFHLAEDGRHGVGIPKKPQDMPQMAQWSELFLDWLRGLGVLD